MPFLEPDALAQAADALGEIVVITQTELAWSDHSCDRAMRRIHADASGALRHLGYEVPTTAEGRPRPIASA